MLPSNTSLSRSNKENVGTPDKPEEDSANPTVPSLLHKLLAFGVWFLPVYLSIYIYIYNNKHIHNILLLPKSCIFTVERLESRNGQKKKAKLISPGDVF